MFFPSQNFKSVFPLEFVSGVENCGLPLNDFLDFKEQIKLVAHLKLAPRLILYLILCYLVIFAAEKS